MRTIQFDTIVKSVRDMCMDAAYNLPKDTLDALKNVAEAEKSSVAKSILEACIDNATIASDKKMPLCQDTGFAVYFVNLGSDVHIENGTIIEAINEGTRLGYTDGFLRKSIVSDPVLHRINTNDNTPAIVHVSIQRGESLDITLAPKGGGSENMSAVAMLKPSDGLKGIVDFVVNRVIESGGNPCPPTIVGVGIGGTFEKVTWLAKKALLRPVGSTHANPEYATIEKDLLTRINQSGVGPQGLGGDTTSLAVHIETFPCHIASLPVAVNLNCHSSRHAHITL